MALRVLAISLVLLLSCLAAVLVGPELVGEQGQFIFWQLRVPRVLVGALVGATLGISGAAFQALFENGLATPSTVGTTAGATLGALSSLVFGAGVTAGALPLVTVFAFVGALGASAVVATIAAKGRARVGDVLLGGIAVTLAASALSQAIQAVADMNALFAATQWSLGQLPQVGFDGVSLLAPFCLAGAMLIMLQLRGLQLMSLGEELAHAQGASIRRVRVMVLVGGSLGVAACVAWCGPISFVGLIVPHVTRRLVGAPLRRAVPVSALVGAAFLVLCDIGARIILPGRELPVGVLTASIGAPVLFLLVLRRG